MYSHVSNYSEMPNDESGAAMNEEHGRSDQSGEGKRAEDSLRDAYWRLASIIEGAYVGTWEWNVQTGETVFNEVWAQIIGYTLDELAPTSIKTWEMYAHPDDLKQSDELLERHFTGELPYYDYECRMKHKDGHWVWVRDRGRVITRTADGKPLMMFGTHTDITERKRADEALRESEERFRAILEVSPVPQAMNDERGNFTFLNKAFIQTFGYTVNDIPNVAAWWPRAYPDLQYRQWVADHWQNDLEESKRTGKPFVPVEIKIRCKDDSVRIFIGSAASLEGNLAGNHLIFLYDITERKRA